MNNFSIDTSASHLKVCTLQVRLSSDRFDCYPRSLFICARSKLTISRDLIGRQRLQCLPLQTSTACRYMAITVLSTEKVRTEAETIFHQIQIQTFALRFLNFQIRPSSNMYHMFYDFILMISHSLQKRFHLLQKLNFVCVKTILPSLCIIRDQLYGPDNQYSKLLNRLFPVLGQLKFLQSSFVQVAEHSCAQHFIRYAPIIGLQLQGHGWNEGQSVPLKVPAHPDRHPCILSAAKQMH